jgi:hypothetical protein
MGRGLLKVHLRRFEEIGLEVERKSEWQRREKYDQKYEFADAIKGGYGIFFLQNPSMLNFQQGMGRENRRKNVERLLEVKAVPKSSQLTRLLDEVDVKEFVKLFNETLKVAEHYLALKGYRVFGSRYLVAVDGVLHFSSPEIHCEHCLRRTVNGKIQYYHEMIAAVVVKAGDCISLPLMPEIIRNEDGEEAEIEERGEKAGKKGGEGEAKKQDCERNAIQRWLDSHAEEYEWLKPVYLGDDLYSCYSVCHKIMEKRQSFIFTCKPDSHKWLMDMVNGAENEKEERRWNGRYHVITRYKWVNGVEIREKLPTLDVNYLDMEEINEETGKVNYHNSWITDITITEENVAELARCGRARWKIENEHNGQLKCRGYHFEHNFSHGKKNAGDVYAVLNELAFLMHGLMMLLDEDYQKARACYGRNDEFFNAMRFAFNRFPLAGWEDLLASINLDVPYG